MIRINLIRGALAAGLASALLLPALAGNVPQYRLTETRHTAAFSPLADGTPVDCTFEDGSNVLFADGTAARGAHAGQGFPIGFDFRMGGRVFDQFAIDPQGYLLFGKGEVRFNGNNNLFFQDATRYANNHHYAGMTVIKYGIKSGNVSYKTEGEAGQRKCTVQFADMNVKESGIRGNAVYTLQVVLSEADNSVSYNFLEVESPYDTHGLLCGLAGWENDDRILVQADGIGADKQVAATTLFDMTDFGSFMLWDADDYLGGTHDDPYCFTLTFTPEPQGVYKDACPVSLAATQTESTVTLNCEQQSDRTATLILMSESPMTEAETPADGTSYQVKHSDGTFASEIGNATVVYYGQSRTPSAVIPDVEPAKTYYFRAYSVNGYPTYSPDPAEFEYTTSHAAPSAVTATAKDAATVTLDVANDLPVMVAVTQVRAGRLHDGETGVFGTPDGDASVGDGIEGGGRVAYIGDAGAIDIEVDPNVLTFFRVWTLKEGILSATWLDAKAVPAPSMPYEPRLEDHSLYVTPTGWTNITTSTDPAINTYFVPTVREPRNENALKGTSSAGSSVTLVSPSLPLAKGGELTFEWALETVRDPKADDDTSVELPQGNEPGIFGLGHEFAVTAGKRGTENALFTATEYTGEMDPVPGDPDHYQTGSSTWMQARATVPALTDDSKIAFKFSTEKSSYLFLRGIKVTDALGSVTEIDAADCDQVRPVAGGLEIRSARGGNYTVHTLDGLKAAEATARPGQTLTVALPAGTYIASGHTFTVK